MRRFPRFWVPALIGIVAFSVCGCNIFPTWPPVYFDEPPTEQGPFVVNEYRIEVPEGADGSPTGITVFKPASATGPRPTVLWIMGSNVQAYYHQSLHETLASWGYNVIISDGRPLTFTDFSYHDRTIRLARQALDLGLSGELGVDVDPERIAAAGYSIGGTLALFTAALDSRIAAVVAWAPTSSPFWTGVSPDALFPQVTQPVLILLAELDHVEPITGFPRDIQAKMADAQITEYVIPQGIHQYFQQPTGADSPTDPVSTITRLEQQTIAIERTLTWLDDQFAIDRAE